MNPRLFSSIERLEDRIAPSGLITATYAGGHLDLAGDAGDHSLSISFTDPSTLVLSALNGTGLVVNGKTATGPVTLAAFTGGVKAKLGDGNDTIQLGPGALPGDVSIDLGGGTNRIVAGNLSIAGNLSVTGAAGADRITFGGSRTVIGGNVAIDLGDGANEIASGLGSFVAGGKLDVKSGSGNDKLVFGGSGFAIGGDTTVTSGAGSDIVGFFATKIGLFGGKLSVSGAASAGQGESFTFSGGEQILFRGAIAIQTGDGSGAVGLHSGGDLHAQSDLSIDTGHGSNTANVTAKNVSVDGNVAVTSAGSVDLKVAAAKNLNVGGDVNVTGGPGTDHVAISGGGTVAGKVNVNLGTGDKQSITLAGTAAQPLVFKSAVNLVQGADSGTSLTKIINAEFQSAFNLTTAGASDTIKIVNTAFDASKTISTGSGHDVIDIHPLLIAPDRAFVDPVAPLITVPRGLAAIIANASVEKSGTGSVLEPATPIDLTSAGLTAASYLRTLSPLSVETAL